MRHQSDLAQIAREIPVVLVRSHLALRRSLSDRHRAEDERLAGRWKDADRASVGAMRLGFTVCASRSPLHDRN